MYNNSLLSKIRAVVAEASKILGLSIPQVSVATATERKLFRTVTQRAVADCNGHRIILRDCESATTNDTVMFCFSALHELRHLWQYKQICSTQEFPKKKLWIKEFETEALPNGDIKKYNSRSVEIDAHAFAVFAMEALCGIKMNINDLPNSKAVQQGYEELIKTHTGE